MSNELPKRKNLRLENYNYSGTGCYFITVCTQNKAHLFGRYNVATIHESPLQRSLLSKAVGYIKMNVSKEIHKQNPLIDVWQRGYVDHIIRNQADFEQHWNCIEYNALKEYK